MTCDKRSTFIPRKTAGYDEAILYIALQRDLGEELIVLSLIKPKGNGVTCLDSYFKFVSKTVHCSSIIMTIIQHNMVIYSKDIVYFHTNILMIFFFFFNQEKDLPVKS